MRKIIQSIVLGLLMLGVARFVYNIMTKKSEQKKHFEETVISAVEVFKVKNRSIPLEVSTSGKLSAKNKMDIYAEVQGVFEKTSKEFKSGVSFRRGETLVRINDSEFRTSIKAKRSNLYNSISAIMPDLKIDFPQSFYNWQSYLNAFDVGSNLNPLPIPGSEKEKYYVAGKNISVQYYEIKNLEEKLRKYSIYAPYSGVLTNTSVNNGTLVRAGQKLGEFIDPSVYELEISLSETMSSFLKVGNKVTIKNLEETKEWQGKVIRKNAVLEQTSQTKKVFIKLMSKDLSDGMYLKAFISGKKQDNVTELNRSLLIDDNSVYIVVDNKLKLKNVNIIHFNENTAIVSGLADGDKLLSKSIPGSYEGMDVKIIMNEEL